MSLVSNSFLNALVALNTRVIAGGFRIAETQNPNLKQAQVLTDTQSVAKRELISTALIFGFSFLTNLVIKPFAARRNIRNEWVTLASGMVGTLLSESISRYISYRHVLGSNTPSPSSSRVPTVLHTATQLPVNSLNPQSNPNLTGASLRSLPKTQVMQNPFANGTYYSL